MSDTAFDPKTITNEIARFRRAREAVLGSSDSDFEHHLADCVREVKRNPLCAYVLSSLAPFDFENWWTPYEKASQNGRLALIALPDDLDHRLRALWGLVESFGSEDSRDLKFHTFGMMFGKHKRADAHAHTVSLVFRPFADLLTERLRELAGMASPGLRELAGVPLSAIPGDGETRIFLSHRSIDKNIVFPWYELLERLGLEPWLDARDMPAGTHLRGGIGGGIDSSCAVIFFVTPNFEAERWLAEEVARTISRKGSRGHKFSIITLLFDGVAVPQALADFVAIEVKSEVQAMSEVLRALPLDLGKPRWKPAIYRG